MRSDEKAFKLSEIIYDEGHMNFVNLISTNNQPTKNEKKISKISTENIHSHPANLKLNINNINPLIQIQQTQYSNQNYDAPIPAEITVPLKNKQDNLLGKKQIAKDKMIKKDSTKEERVEDSSSCLFSCNDESEDESEKDKTKEVKK
jgi:hypothetical protein